MRQSVPLMLNFSQALLQLLFKEQILFFDFILLFQKHGLAGLVQDRELRLIPRLLFELDLEHALGQAE